MTSSGDRDVIQNHDSQRNAEENISNFVVSSVPAYDLALSCARAPASTVMTKFGFSIYSEPTHGMLQKSLKYENTVNKIACWINGSTDQAINQLD